MEVLELKKSGDISNAYYASEKVILPYSSDPLSFVITWNSMEVPGFLIFFVYDTFLNNKRNHRLPEDLHLRPIFGLRSTSASRSPLLPRKHLCPIFDLR